MCFLNPQNPLILIKILIQKLYKNIFLITSTVKFSLELFFFEKIFVIILSKETNVFERKLIIFDFWYQSRTIDLISFSPFSSNLNLLDQAINGLQIN